METDIPLREIIFQLNELFELPTYKSVAVLFDDGELNGWCIVNKDNQNQITPYDNIEYNSLKELYQVIDKYK